jgi:hypothetical protein
MEKTDEELPKPVLGELFEAIAVVMDINEGWHSLELHFENGYLGRWSHLNKNNA